MKSQPKPFSTYLLMLLTFFLAVSGFVGGAGLLADPTGASMQMPLTLLENSPFNNYLLPGIILLLAMGVFPALILIGLQFKPRWTWLNVFNIYPNRHWAWTFGLYQSIILILWIDIQVMWVGYDHLIQTVYALLGVALLIGTMLPRNMQHYKQPATTGRPELRNVQKLQLKL